MFEYYNDKRYRKYDTPSTVSFSVERVTVLYVFLYTHQIKIEKTAKQKWIITSLLLEPVVWNKNILRTLDKNCFWTTVHSFKMLFQFIINMRNLLSNILWWIQSLYIVIQSSYAWQDTSTCFNFPQLVSKLNFHNLWNQALKSLRLWLCCHT